MTFKIKRYHIVKFGIVFRNGRCEGAYPSRCVIVLSNFRISYYFYSQTRKFVFKLGPKNLLQLIVMYKAFVLPCPLDRISSSEKAIMLLTAMLLTSWSTFSTIYCGWHKPHSILVLRLCGGAQNLTKRLVEEYEQGACWVAPQNYTRYAW